MKSLLIYVGIMLMSFCQAQNLPLNTGFSTIPAGAHLKDTNNELSPYIGNYVANFNGNEITLFITKLEDKLEQTGQKNYYMDALIVKYIVKNSAGNVLQDTKNNNTYNIELYSLATNPSKNAVTLYYSGTNCSVGWGDIYLKKISSTQISLEYRPDDITTTAAKCPPNLDTTIYLPATKDLIFTKQ
ncbi:DUF6705 family protein [uncultured Chryseobacterium sp.]|uniref:DUF6705 family protein n=1 Tax=uncultured Chryseobacterium sp. TaxID=259322 RepID=UPI0025E17989|nr:DUF6705 family protein [uncultured Chryseobacterium sp.]